MSNQPDSKASHSLLDTLHAAWLEEEKTRWLDREVITQDEYNSIPSRVGYIRKLIPETRNSVSARRYRDVCIIPSGQRIPTLLVEAGTRQDKDAILNNIQLCFRTFEGKLQKAIFFIWEFFPDDRVSLDVEVYGYDAGLKMQMLLQKIRVVPTEHESSGYVELPVSFREIFSARLPEDIPVAGNVRVSLKDLRDTAEENLLSSELEPALIEDCLPDPVSEQPKLHELPTEDPRSGNNPEDASGNTGEPKVPIPETMVDYLMRYVNTTRHLAALFPADDPRLEELARNAHATMPSTLEKLGLDPKATGSLMDTAIYDVAIFGDDSGSMGQSGRYDSLSEIARRFIPIAADISHSGVSVRFINSKVDGELNDICEGSKIDNIFKTIRPGGFTPIGTRLKEKIINPFLERLQSPNAGPMRPRLVVIITDGEPSREPESALKDAIIDCKKALMAIKNSNGDPYGPSSIVFCLSIVGNSADADKYVREIADDAEVNDMVYCDLDPLDKQISAKSPNLNLVKLLKAAIDKA